MVSPQLFTIADVGCDHAYVSIALIARRLAQKVIAMDVRKGPLDIAGRNVSEAGYLNEIDIRLGDGLEQLKPGEADAIIIAGMGGLLIKGILERGESVLSYVEKRPTLILQPQSDLKEVRIFLYEHAYHIVLENMLVEDGKYYTVMKAEPVNEGNHYAALKTAQCETDKMYGYEEVEWVYGKYNLVHRDEVLFEYLQKERAVLSQIRDKIQKTIEESQDKMQTIPESTILRMESVQREILLNEQALAYYQ